MGVVLGYVYAEDLKSEVLELNSKYGNDVTERAVKLMYGVEYEKITTDLTLLELAQLGPMSSHACTTDTAYIITPDGTVAGKYDFVIDDSLYEFRVSHPDEATLWETIDQLFQEAANSTSEESEDLQSALDYIRDAYKHAAEELTEGI